MFVFSLVHVENMCSTWTKLKTNMFQLVLLLLMCDRSFDKLIWHNVGPKSFLFGTAQFSLWASGAVNYDYIVNDSINSLLIGSRCFPNGTHTKHCWANLAHASKHIKNSDVHNTHWYIVFSFNIVINN